MFHQARVRILASGMHNIPRKGPVLFLVNHFSSPGFSVLWLAMALSTVCPKDTTWVMTDAWTFPGRVFRKPARSMSHILLTRIAKVYGFFPFQPVSPDPVNIIEQALSVRKILSFLKIHPQTRLCLAPEGQDSQDTKLGFPPKGSGLFIKAISDLGYPLIPVGFYSTPGTCHIRFGEAIHLKLDQSSTKIETDWKIRQQVIKSIGNLLPDHFVR